MSPHALRQRMKHGNVYPPERTAVALEKFFTESNLTALRELSLRLVARRVEDQLEDTIAGEQLPLVTDRVLVLVDGSPASLRAVRRAAMLAGAVHAALVAVVVETPELGRQPFDRHRDIQEALDDAVDLGADVVRVESKDVVAGLEQVAHSSRATHVVLPHSERSGLARFRERAVVDRLIEQLPDVEIHVVGPGERRGQGSANAKASGCVLTGRLVGRRTREEYPPSGHEEAGRHLADRPLVLRWDRLLARVDVPPERRPVPGRCELALAWPGARVVAGDERRVAVGQDLRDALRGLLAQLGERLDACCVQSLGVGRTDAVDDRQVIACFGFRSLDRGRGLLDLGDDLLGDLVRLRLATELAQTLRHRVGLVLVDEDADRGPCHR